ncbi:DNA-directed RNA polymerase subunit beta [Pseudogracilibacillus auburnensis]|uniref:DNA-directed RNA polymerase subunit beta n=1 Tax=Pseudogracilibacillus auburnensis TaxID=1494959 RepID=A0A2V3VV44_9BACI|nr:DNA-directed RNA polymerase subunit beta [Pseudogracilibacillus auburnensis]MBO1005574.1 DNA-directed RNA polymerase subunit beta [Pseudogracilibacillus auburnensis]PXW85843.1 DNA-directed RNA polymerase subunit beta [Pseudogracilibacillus auburnensis]
MVANSVREEKHEEVKTKEKSRRKRKTKLRTRKFPIWLRIIVVLLLFAGCLVLGLMVGYGVIGDGTPTEVLEKSTWQHIVDIINKEK